MHLLLSNSQTGFMIDNVLKVQERNLVTALNPFTDYLAKLILRAVCFFVTCHLNFTLQSLLWLRDHLIGPL